MAAISMVVYVFLIYVCLSTVRIVYTEDMTNEDEFNNMYGKCHFPSTMFKDDEIDPYIYVCKTNNESVRSLCSILYNNIANICNMTIPKQLYVVIELMKKMDVPAENTSSLPLCDVIKSREELMKKYINFTCETTCAKNVAEQFCKFNYYTIQIIQEIVDRSTNTTRLPGSTSFTSNSSTTNLTRMAGINNTENLDHTHESPKQPTGATITTAPETVTNKTTAETVAVTNKTTAETVAVTNKTTAETVAVTNKTTAETVTVTKATTTETVTENTTKIATTNRTVQRFPIIMDNTPSSDTNTKITTTINTVHRNAENRQEGVGKVVNDSNMYNAPSSGNFMAYFLTAVVLCIAGYVIFHNKQKIIAFIIEGRSMRSRRRPNGSGDYKKLQSNVEEVMPALDSSTSTKNYIY